MGSPVASRVPKTLSHRLVCALVALAAIVVYSNTLSYGAAWDDSRFVFASGATQGVAEIPAMFRTPLLRDMPPGRAVYRPLTSSSYALDWSLGGGQARFFHWSNVALHALVSGLVALLLFRLGATALAAGLGGMVFAVHPVHVEAVANIAGRSELLVGLFGVSAALVYLGLGPGLARGRSLAVLLLLWAATLSKEHGIMVPAVLVAVEALRPGAEGSPFRRVLGRWPLWLGMGAVVAVYMGARRVVLGTFTTVDVAPFIEVLPSWQRVTTAVANWTQYARLHVFPLDLSVDYGPAIILPSTPAHLAFWSGVATAALALALAVWAYRKHRLATLGLAWFATVMFPSSNLLVPIAQWMAERFFYLPSVGLSMAVAALVMWTRTGLDARELRIASVGALLALALLTARSWTRNQTWVDTGTVIATLIAEHPEAFRAQWFVGRLYFEQGRVEEAFTALDSATTLQPNAIELPLERAEWLLRLGRVEEAEQALRDLPFGRHADREAHLVRALVAQDRTAAADSALAAARRAFPANPRLAALADSLAALRARTPPDTVQPGTVR